MKIVKETQRIGKYTCWENGANKKTAGRSQWLSSICGGKGMMMQDPDLKTSIIPFPAKMLPNSLSATSNLLLNFVVNQYVLGEIPPGLYSLENMRFQLFVTYSKELDVNVDG